MVQWTGLRPDPLESSWLTERRQSHSRVYRQPPSSMPAGWASVARDGGKSKPRLPWETCWGLLPGQKVPPRLCNQLSHVVLSTLSARHPFSCFLAQEQDLEGENRKPRPHTTARLEPSFTTTGRWKGTASDSGSRFPMHLAQKAQAAAGHPLPQCPGDGLPWATQSWSFPTLSGKRFII